MGNPFPSLEVGFFAYFRTGFELIKWNRLRCQADPVSKLGLKGECVTIPSFLCSRLMYVAECVTIPVYMKCLLVQYKVVLVFEAEAEIPGELQHFQHTTDRFLVEIAGEPVLF